MAAAVIALLPALWFGGQRLAGADSTDGRVDAPIPDVTSTRTPTTTPSAPSARPSATKAPASPSLPRVPPAGPRRLTVPGLLDVGFDNSVEPAGGVLQAASTAEAARWGSRGTPASPGTDTVYLIGKVYRQDTSAFDALPSVKVGATVTVRTQSGSVLRYTVQNAGARAAKNILRTADFTRKVPGKLVLVGILFDAENDQRTGKYFVVVAQLSGARR